MRPQHDKADLEGEVGKQEAALSERRESSRVGKTIGLAMLVFTAALAYFTQGHADVGKTAILATESVSGAVMIGTGIYHGQRAKALAPKVAQLKSRLAAMISRGAK